MVDRILLVLKIKNLTPSKFADEIGIQRSSMSHIMSGRNMPSLDLITKILGRYPDINSDWLVKGEGPMTKTFQIDLFDQAAENKTPEATPKPKDDQPVTEPVNDIKKEDVVEKSEENQLKTPVKETERVDIKPVEPVIQVPLQEEEKPAEKNTEQKASIGQAENTMALPANEPAIEKIVIFYKNRTFKEYYPS
ncbi:MAG TPA: helix-turn-helix domain-containing protein [Bacteroidales bacterium]|nr:helix-turn-helix domain-containing protein [Bacteroidales bacterium]